MNTLYVGFNENLVGSQRFVSVALTNFADMIGGSLFFNCFLTINIYKLCVI